MNERKDYQENQQRKRSRERMLREKRRRRRRKKLLRFLVLILLLLIVFVILLLGRLFAERKVLPAMSSESKLSWDFGTADIVLDAGHGGKDQGASGGDAIEKEITLKIAKKAEKYLEDAGYKVKLTREDDTFIDLEERGAYANRKEAKVFVSIHCNSSEEGEGYGIETFYSEQKGEESRALAGLLQACMIEQTQARDREIKTADHVVTVTAKMPSALVETGFLSDAEERLLLQQEEYQEKLAKGIADGIIAYLTE